MRQPKDSDFFIPLPDVGVFRFGRRTYGDKVKIRAMYLSLVREHGDEDPDLSIYSSFIATFSVLCVEAPEGWSDLADLDLVSTDDNEDRIFTLFHLLKEKEDSLRKGDTKSSEAAGA